MAPQNDNVVIINWTCRKRYRYVITLAKRIEVHLPASVTSTTEIHCTDHKKLVRAMMLRKLKKTEQSYTADSKGE